MMSRPRVTVAFVLSLVETPTEAASDRETDLPHRGSLLDQC